MTTINTTEANGKRKANLKIIQYLRSILYYTVLTADKTYVAISR